MKKYTDSKITKETLFQTFIKEKPDVLFLSIIFSTIFIISVVYTCKSTLIPKLPEKRCFKRLLMKLDVLFLKIILFTICRIYVIST